MVKIKISGMIIKKANVPIIIISVSLLLYIDKSIPHFIPSAYYVNEIF